MQIGKVVVNKERAYFGLTQLQFKLNLFQLDRYIDNSYSYSAYKSKESLGACYMTKLQYYNSAAPCKHSLYCKQVSTHIHTPTLFRLTYHLFDSLNQSFT